MTEERWSSMGRPGTYQRHECPECGGPEFRTLGHGYAHKSTCSKYVQGGEEHGVQGEPGTAQRSASDMKHSRPSGHSQSDKEQDRQARDARNGDCECGATHYWYCEANPYAEVGNES